MIKEVDELNPKTLKESFESCGINMRNLTEEEQQSLYKGLEEISTPTGINLFDYLDEDTTITNQETASQILNEAHTVTTQRAKKNGEKLIKLFNKYIEKGDCNEKS